MPQMAPLSWLTLMILFISMLILFNIINYFSFSSTPEKESKIFKKKLTINWKW